MEQNRVEWCVGIESKRCSLSSRHIDCGLAELNGVSFGDLDHPPINPHRFFVRLDLLDAKRIDYAPPPPFIVVWMQPGAERQ